MKLPNYSIYVDGKLMGYRKATYIPKEKPFFYHRRPDLAKEAIGIGRVDDVPNDGQWHTLVIIVDEKKDNNQH